MWIYPFVKQKKKKKKKKKKRRKQPKTTPKYQGYIVKQTALSKLFCIVFPEYFPMSIDMHLIFFQLH